MKRLDLIDQLQTVQSSIELYDKRLNSKIPEGYLVFGNVTQWRRQQEINRKCFNFWKRKFNRISFKLMYNL